MSVQIATRVDPEQAEIFKNLTRQLGTTPSDTLRLFICAFNTYGGFPYLIRVPQEKLAVPFETEKEALEFANHFSWETFHETR